MIRLLFPLVALAAAILASAQPIILISTDFTSNAISGPLASSVEWSAAPGVVMGSAGDVTALNGYNFGVRGGSSNADTILVDSNLSTAGQNATQRGFSATFTVPMEFSLNQLTVRAGHVGSDGSKRAFASVLNYRIVKVSDGSIAASGSQWFDYAGTEVFFDRAFALAGTLEANGTYRIEVGMNNCYDGAFALFDRVSLTAYPEPTATPSVARRTNLAKYQKATVNVQGASYAADFAVDGIASNFHSWRVGSAVGPHWLEITYPRAVTIGSVHVYSGLLLATTSQLWQNFRFQHHDGTAWVDIPGSIVWSNALPERSVLFTSPVTATRFRLLGGDYNSRAIRELAMFPPNPNALGVEQGYPIGTDVVVDLAHKRPVVASSIAGTGYALHAVDGFVHDDSRWLSSEAAAGQTLEIDLLADHAIASAHLHSGDLATGSGALANFLLEFWNGTGWQAIPGAAITGNSSVALVVAFSSTVTTSRIRLVSTDASSSRVAQLQVFPPRSGGYPLGTGLRFESPFKARWNDFADDTQQLRIHPVPDLRLAVVNGEAVLADGAAATAALDWQLLLNYRDGSYRIRNVASGLCLALGALSNAADTPVVAEVYSGMPYQDWFLEYVAPTKFRLLNAYSGLALQSLGATTIAGTPLVATTPGTSALQRWEAVRQTHYPKKGIAAIGSVPVPPFADPAATWVSHMHANVPHASWVYTWGRQRSDAFPFLTTNQAFNPMQWGNFSFAHGTTSGPLDTIRVDLHSSGKPAALLGFNEPDRTDQSNLTVATAVQLWPRLLAMEVPLVSPVPASASTTTGWFVDFYNQADALGYRVDHTAVHWYANPNASSLISVLQNAYNKWKRPVWLTEFSVVRWSGTMTWTDADNFNFLAEFLWRAESLPWLQRYSLFNYREAAPGDPVDPIDMPDAPRSNSVRSDGTLTAFGELYAGWDGVTSIVNHRPYHLHNRGAYRRIQNSMTSGPVSAVSPEQTAGGVQWYLVPGSDSATVRIVSTLDGRMLALSGGTTVDLAPAGDTSAASVWRFVADQYGWHFLEHPQFGVRLGIDGAGVPTTGLLTSTGNTFKWRLVAPAQTEPLLPQAAFELPPTNLDPQAIVMIAAAAPEAAEYYFDEVSGNPGGSDSGWQTALRYDDAGLISGLTYIYRVQKRDAFGNVSPWSAEFSRSAGPDTTAPSPSPMAFASLPESTGFSSATMTAATASDLNAVEYQFACIAGGGPTSAWQSATLFAPTGLAYGTTFTYVVRARDVAGNVTADSPAASFTTETPDLVPPTILTLVPANGASSATAAGNLVITFSEPVVKGAGNIVLRRLGGTLVETIAVGSAQVLVSDATVTIDPSVSLMQGASYYIELAAGTFTDGFGNAFSGISGNSSWSFAVAITGAVATYSGSNGAWNQDRWNNAANWTPAGVPTGSRTVVVQANRAPWAVNSTPAYTGNLILRGGSTLGIGPSTANNTVNALGTGSILMESGSRITLRYGANFTFNQSIVLSGPVTFVVSESTNGQNTARTFAGSLSGSHSVSIVGQNGNIVNLNATNTFTSLSAWVGGSANYKIVGNAAGSLGTGSVTIGAGVNLVIGHSTSMAPTASLYLNGVRSTKVAGEAKLILNQSLTIAQLWKDGVQLAAGAYTKTSGLVDSGGNALISGNGTLTVTGAPGGSFASDDSGISGLGNDRYLAWSGGLSFDEDLNADGIGNGLAWVLGASHPSEDVRALLPIFAASDSEDGKLEFVFRRSSTAVQAGVVVSVEISTSLAKWSVAMHEGSGPGQVTFVEETDGFRPGLDRIIVRLPAALAAEGNLFVRLRAERVGK